MMNQRLTGDTMIRQKRGILSSQSPEEILAMDVESGSCFAFNGPSGRIWGLLETPRRIRDIVGLLVDEYEIDEAACTDQTIAYLDKLLSEDILEIVAPTD